MDKEKSIVRSKRSVIRLMDAIADLSLSSIPGGSGVYKMAKVLVQHAKDFYDDRKEERLAEFHEKILDNLSDEEQQTLLKADFSIEEYYSILTQLLQDEEDKKTDIYAKIFQAILLKLIPANYKIHIIKSIRELKYTDFDLMRRIYINEKYEFKATGNKIIQIRNITQPTEPIEFHSIQSLIRHGYLQDNDKSKPPWPTELNKFIVELLYDAEQLTDKAL